MDSWLTPLPFANTINALPKKYVGTFAGQDLINCTSKISGTENLWLTSQSDDSENFGELISHFAFNTYSRLEVKRLFQFPRKVCPCFACSLPCVPCTVYHDSTILITYGPCELSIAEIRSCSFSWESSFNQTKLVWIRVFSRTAAWITLVRL